MKPRVKNFDIQITKVNLKKPEYEYFRDLFQMNCTKELFEKENLAQIRKNIQQSLSEEYAKLFVIIISKDPAYYLQSSNEGCFMFKVEGIAVFIYKTRCVEIPRYTFLEKFEKNTMDMKKVEELQNNISLIYKRNLCEETEKRMAERIKEWVALFYIKYASLEATSVAQFETELLTKLRIFLILISTATYWNLYLANKVEYIVENAENEALMVFELDFSNQKPKKQKKKLLLFQKKGVNLSFFSTLKFRKKEIIGFLVMAILFFTMVGCRGYDLLPIDEERPFQPVRDTICPHKSNIVMLCGTLLFSLVFQRFFQKHLKSKKAKAAKKNN